MNYVILDEADDYIHLRLSVVGEPGTPGSFPDIASLLTARPHPKNIVIDMRGIQWIDSSNIGGLIGVHKKCLEMSRKSILHSVQPAVTDVLKFCKLDRFFMIKSDQKEALALAIGGAP
jgi:anti-anti-sigma factor